MPRSDPVQKSGAIVWLASYPKSGNTWVRNFLHNLIGAEHGIDPDERNDINQMGRVTTWDIGEIWYRDFLEPPLTDHSTRAFAAVRPKVHDKIARTAKGVVFCKTHSALVAHHGVPMHTGAVTAGAIYIVRNPLDVAVSLSHHLAAPLDTAIEVMATPGFVAPIQERVAYELYGSWSENVASWTRRAQRTLLVLRYEDLLERTHETFEKLAAWLRLSPTPDVLAEAIRRSSFAELQRQEDEKGYIEKPRQAERFFRAGESGQWRTELSASQVEAIVAAHGPQMRRLGYSI